MHNKEANNVYHWSIYFDEYRAQTGFPVKGTNMRKKQHDPVKSDLVPWGVKFCICKHVESRKNLLDGYGFSFRSVGDINHSFGRQISQNQVETIVPVSLSHQSLCKFLGTLCTLHGFRETKILNESERQYLQEKHRQVAPALGIRSNVKLQDIGEKSHPPFP